MFRTRFKKEIVAEFLPPARSSKQQKMIILCDGMPSMPRKQPLVEFLSGKGYWAFYPRWRGAWESGGQFLERSPHEDILYCWRIASRISGACVWPKVLLFARKDLRYRRKFRRRGSYSFISGPADHKSDCQLPSCGLGHLRKEQKKETSNPSYPAYIRAAFGNGYRLSAENWNKLRGGVFYNPAHHLKELTPSKILMFHAKDDPYIPWKVVDNFARRAGITLKLLSRGGHLKTEYVVRKYSPAIKNFLDS